MKKRLLIICSIIGVLLAGFQFPIYAEETAQDYSSSTSIMSSSALDQYFYDNYELLPYIESDGSQYINTGIKASSNLYTSIKFSNISSEAGLSALLFGSRVSANSEYYGIGFDITDEQYIYHFFNLDNSYNYSINQYDIVTCSLDKNKAYFNNNLIYTFDDPNISTNNLDIYIFSTNNNGTTPPPAVWGIFRLYSFKIYDYSANDGDGALVRDYYPARSKSGGVIGLYDAVSKTFVTTSGSVPFGSPTGDSVNLSLGANITQFLSGSLSWIGAIFEGINEMPIIWVFIAIALAGVAFRWARRIVHF